MALRNGLLVHGPTHWAIAVRNKAGEIEVASGAKPSFARGRLATTPIIRGPLRLAEALAVVPLARTRLRSARLPFEDPRVIAAAAMASAASAAARKFARGNTSRETAIALIGLVPALAALRDPDLAAYHGAEHKAIGAYESGGSAADEPKEHERCGSNLIGPMLAFSVAGQVLVEGTLERPNAIARGAASLAATGAAVEVFAFSERNPDAALSRAVHGAGTRRPRRYDLEPSSDSPQLRRFQVRRTADRTRLDPDRHLLLHVADAEADAADEAAGDQLQVKADRDLRRRRGG
jgi:hypothetical protein